MKFEYKDNDEAGKEILDAISAAGKFNRWMFDTIRPFCSGKIMEVGSGVGNISQFFVNEGADITLSDIRENYRERLRSRFPGIPVSDIDIVHPDFRTKNKEQAGSFDAVFALNVVEHIENDSLAVENMMWLLKPGGTLVILVPAHQALYNGIDKALEHYRRYNKALLKKIMSSHGYTEKLFYFNATGIPAWWISGKLFRQNTIPEGEMKLYNMLVPVFRIIDKITGNKIGLSVIGVNRK